MSASRTSSRWLFFLFCFSAILDPKIRLGYASSASSTFVDDGLLLMRYHPPVSELPFDLHNFAQGIRLIERDEEKKPAEPGSIFDGLAPAAGRAGLAVVNFNDLHRWAVANQIPDLHQRRRAQRAINREIAPHVFGEMKQIRRELRGEENPEEFDAPRVLENPGYLSAMRGFFGQIASVAMSPFNCCRHNRNEVRNALDAEPVARERRGFRIGA